MFLKQACLSPCFLFWHVCVSMSAAAMRKRINLEHSLMVKASAIISLLDAHVLLHVVFVLHRYLLTHRDLHPKSIKSLANRAVLTFMNTICHSVWPCNSYWCSTFKLVWQEIMYSMIFSEIMWHSTENGILLSLAYYILNVLK